MGLRRTTKCFTGKTSKLIKFKKSNSISDNSSPHMRLKCLNLPADVSPSFRVYDFSNLITPFVTAAVPYKNFTLLNTAYFVLKFQNKLYVVLFPIREKFPSISQVFGDWSKITLILLYNLKK